MAGSAADDHGPVTDPTFEVARSLLHALLEELSGPHDETDRNRRYREAASALESFPRPAALFGSISGAEPLANSAWRERCSQLEQMPPRLTEVIEAAVRTQTTQLLSDLEVRSGSFTSYFSVTAQALHSTPGALVACVDLTDQVLARRIAAGPESLIWAASTSGTADYVNHRWRVEVGMYWKDALHMADMRRWMAALRETERGTDVGEIDVRLLVTTGAHRWHRVRLRREVGYVLCCAYSIDGDRAPANAYDELLLEARQARADAEQAIRVKDVFLAAVSHELRAPLTTMLLWEKVLREHSTDEASRTQALDAIHQSATAQARLVGDMLDYARGVSGKLYLDVRRVDVEQIVRDALDAVRPAASTKTIALTREGQPFAAGLHADATRLRQILDNLLSNAIKFTPAGGNVRIRLAIRGTMLAIEVEDTGRGIAPALLTRIFEPFTQAEDPLTRREGGLGLGLTISRQLTELHRGTLIASSDGLGLGAKFTLSLPLAGSARALSPPLGTKTRHLGGARVLVVDDDPEVRKALTVLLGRAGAVVITAESAAAARTQISSGAPHVIVCDIAMPDEDGYSLLRYLRAQGCKLPSIALTAFATELDTQRALDAGFDVHLTKPISLDRLVDTLSELLASEPASSS
jgi:signal transduction histidine kinase/ActR/RegA family two-component response regulator